MHLCLISSHLHQGRRGSLSASSSLLIQLVIRPRDLVAKRSGSMNRLAVSRRVNNSTYVYQGSLIFSSFHQAASHFAGLPKRLNWRHANEIPKTAMWRPRQPPPVSVHTAPVAEVRVNADARRPETILFVLVQHDQRKPCFMERVPNHVAPFDRTNRQDVVQWR